jgi:N,N'-diacetyllegionaminate synthase
MVHVKIGNKTIGDNFPCFTIAEAGANHDGDLQKAFKLIDAAIEAKSDSIKFQTYTASKLVTKTAPKYWNDGKIGETQFDVFNKLDHLKNDDWKQIFEYAKDKNFICFSTPFDEESVDLLYKFDVPAFKIASADITHLPLIKHISQKNLPIFISTGMANDLEIKEAIDVIENEGNNDIIIMHCITSYPTNPEDANLEMIRTLKKNYPEYVIGYSDHTLGTLIPALSTIYGAKCIEKHFTFDSSLTISPDHRLSLDKLSFKTMVNQLKIAHSSNGSAIRDSFNVESESIKYARRSIVLTKKLSKGSIITKEMIDVKRPGTGISPKFLEEVIGKILTNNVDDDIPLQWSDLGIHEK